MMNGNTDLVIQLSAIDTVPEAIGDSACVDR